MKIPHFFIGFLCVIFAHPFVVGAYYYENRQEINVMIHDDYTANGTWTFHIGGGRSVEQVSVPEYKGYGMTASTAYTLQGVLNEKKEPFQIDRIGEESFSFNPKYVYISGGPAVTTYVNYKIRPAFKSPVAIYELWVGRASFGQSPIVNLTTPKSWKLISSWPTEVTGGDGHYSIEYPATYPEGHSILFAFQTGGSGVVEKVGRYTVSGQPKEVEKIKLALTRLQGVDELMLKSLGIKPPSDIVIISDDITQAGGIGYEAEALAASPNIIIFNNELTKSKTVSEIAETLGHELTHLAMLDQNLFQGREYYAPWFDEGIAVFFQTLIHKQIFNDPTERVRVEELHRTHSISSQEAKALYESLFDYDFSGDRDLGTYASYDHAGLVFARFFDVVGVEGFKKLFMTIQRTTQSDDEDRYTLLTALKSISGLSETQLLYPGKAEKDIAGIVSRIARSGNDEEVSAKIVTEYIQNSVKPYFGKGGKGTVIPATGTEIKKETKEKQKVTIVLSPKSPTKISLPATPRLRPLVSATTTATTSKPSIKTGIFSTFTSWFK